jgi:transporter family-2 protein
VTKLPYVLAAVLMGGLLTLQPGINAEVGRRIGNGFAAGMVSILVSGIVSVALVFGTRQEANWGATLSMPWYLWIAGVIGVVFVVGATLLAPILGAGLLFVSVVAGQMLMSTLNDYTGFAGYGSTHGVDGWRLAGIGLVLVGVWVFQRGG